MMFKRIALPLLLALGVSLAASAPAHALAPATGRVCPAIYPAPAYCSTQPISRSVADDPSYKGWGYVAANYCAPGMYCIALYRETAPAWQWTGTAWKQTTRGDGQQVWVHPYASGWSWTWTSDRGWLAMRSSYLMKGYRVEYLNDAAR